MRTLCLILSLCFPALFAGSCVSGRMPSWVSSKPLDAAYFHGIGSASKKDPDYISRAKNEALADLASGIEVRVNVESKLDIREINGIHLDDFKYSSKIDASKLINEYEQAGHFESRDTYYIWLRLSKQQYYEAAGKRRADAEQLATDLLFEGNSLKRQGRDISAVKSYCKGLEAIEPYLDKVIKVEIDGESASLVPALVQGIEESFTRFALTRTQNGPIQYRKYIDDGTIVTLAQMNSKNVRESGLRFNVRSLSEHFDVLLDRDIYPDEAGLVKVELNDYNTAKYDELTLTLSRKTFYDGSSALVSSLLGALSGKLAYKVISQPLPVRIEIAVKPEADRYSREAADDITEAYYKDVEQRIRKTMEERGMEIRADGRFDYRILFEIKCRHSVYRERRGYSRYLGVDAQITCYQIDRPIIQLSEEIGFTEGLVITAFNEIFLEDQIFPDLDLNMNVYKLINGFQEQLSNKLRTKI